MQQGYAESFPATAHTKFLENTLPVARVHQEFVAGNPPTKRMLIIGHGRHGKDEVCAALHGKGGLWCAGSTSWAATPYVARALKQIPQYAFEHRHENRQFWKDYCDFLRKDDPLFLVRLLIADGANIVSGVRDYVEVKAAAESGLFSEILWVNRPGFPEDPTVTYDPAKFCTSWILNDGTLEELHAKAVAWALEKGFLSQ